MVDAQWIIDEATEAFAKTCIVAELDADSKYDMKAQTRALKQLAFQEKQQTEQQAARDSANQPASVLDVERLIEEKMKTRSRPTREARQSNHNHHTQKSHKNENHKQGKGKGGKGPKNKSKGSKGSRLERRLERRQRRQRDSRQKARYNP